MHFVISQMDNIVWLLGQHKKVYSWKISWNVLLLLDAAAADVSSFIFLWHFEHCEKESKVLEGDG